MNFEFYSGNILIYSGLLLSLILAIVYLLKSKSYKANIWLALFFLLSAFVFAAKLFNNQLSVEHLGLLTEASVPIHILQILCIYFYMYLILNVSARIKYIQLLHFLPLVVLVLATNLIKEPQTQLNVENSFEFDVMNSAGMDGLDLAIILYVYFIVYVALIYLQFKNYIKTHSPLNKKQESLKNWISALITISVIYIVVVGALYVFGVSGEFNFYTSEILVFILIVITIKLLSYPRIFDTEIIASNERNRLSGPQKIELMADLDAMMKTNKLYLQNDLKLAHLSAQLDIPEHIISLTIKEHTSKSFRDYINSFRVLKAKEILQKSYGLYTIEAIASQAGFNSRASFYNAFKKQTNKTPKAYVESLK